RPRRYGSRRVFHEDAQLVLRWFAQLQLVLGIIVNRDPAGHIRRILPLGIPSITAGENKFECMFVPGIGQDRVSIAWWVNLRVFCLSLSTKLGTLERHNDILLLAVDLVDQLALDILPIVADRTVLRFDLNGFFSCRSILSCVDLRRGARIPVPPAFLLLLISFSSQNLIRLVYDDDGDLCGVGEGTDDGSDVGTDDGYFRDIYRLDLTLVGAAKPRRRRLGLLVQQVLHG